MRRHGPAAWIFAVALPFAAAGPLMAQEIDDDAVEDADEGIERVPAQNLDVVQHKSFNKEGRLELFPHAFSIVTTNHFANRQLILTGASVAYHFREQVYLEGTFQYYPWRTGVDPTTGTEQPKDLKGLTYALLTLNAGSEEAPPVEVPAEKLFFGLNLGLSPVYGKINLVGEHVQNFDVSFLAGGGLLQIEKHFYRAAGFDENLVVIPEELAYSPERKFYPAGNLGVSTRFPLVDWFTLKADARLLGYVQQVPDYLASPQIVEGEAVYPNKASFTTSFFVTVGGSFFLPRQVE